jgi:hypothetical protein
LDRFIFIKLKNQLEANLQADFVFGSKPNTKSCWSFQAA